MGTAQAPPPAPRVLIVMGVSGVGKSTVARALATRLGWDLAEGDDFHPPANVAKMAAGRPLSDADRWPWLAAIRSWIDGELTAGRCGVVTCSALRRVYRERLLAPGVMFVELLAPRRVVADRLADRHGHFMPASLLDSQLATLEPLAADEPAVQVDADGPVGAIVDDVLAAAGLGRR